MEGYPTILCSANVSDGAALMENTCPDLAHYAEKIEDLAAKLGLDYYPIDFEVVPNN